MRSPEEWEAVQPGEGGAVDVGDGLSGVCCWWVRRAHFAEVNSSKTNLAIDAHAQPMQRLFTRFTVRKPVAVAFLDFGFDEGVHCKVNPAAP